VAGSAGPGRPCGQGHRASTGNLLVGAGFSSADKLSFTASIKQENVFGSGNYLGLEVNTSSSNRNLVLSTVDPYWTVDGISRAIDVYYRTSKPINSQGATSTSSPHPGAAIRFGVPFSDYDTVFFGIGVEQTASAKSRMPLELLQLSRALRRHSSHRPCR
jgi:outer membrane protein insertion porin family